MPIFSRSESRKGPPAEYTKGLDSGDQELIAHVESSFVLWREGRRPHEAQWFINAAYLRGQQDVEWSDRLGRLLRTPTARSEVPIPRILGKATVRRARLTKERPRPQVVPANTDHKNRIDAKATEKALLYQHRRLALEDSLSSALMWAEITGRGYWWFYWDTRLPTKVRIDDPLFGPQVESLRDAEGTGDIVLEVGNSFEVFVPELDKEELGDQEEIIRARILPVNTVKMRYPEVAEYIVGDMSHEEAFHYQLQIAGLNSQTGGAGVDPKFKTTGEAGYVVVKEWFSKPTLQYPDGRYAVVANGVLLRKQDLLPYGFGDFKNPYPCVTFRDLPAVGQFYGTTFVEQLIGPQRSYNSLRQKLEDHLRLMVHPKILPPRAAGLPEGTWKAAPGEIIPITWMPGMPSPREWIWHPPPISSDLWRSIDLAKREIDEVSQVYPVSEGATASTKSGFQTNLLQEATDEVFAPLKRMHELAMEDAYRKIRRLMKRRYTIPRLISIIGKHKDPEIEEFHADDIDEAAEIVIQTGSGLPALKAARIQAVIDLFEKGILGDPADPEVKRRALAHLDLGSAEEDIDFARQDEELARLENNAFDDMREVAPPEFFHNHQVHIAVHASALKTAEASRWDAQDRMRRIHHILMHISFIEPMGVVQLAALYGIPPQSLPGVIANTPPPAPALPPGPGAPPQGLPPAGPVQQPLPLPQ